MISVTSQKGKEKRSIVQILRRKRRGNGHGRPKPLRYYSNTSKSTKPNANSTASTSKLIRRACTCTEVRRCLAVDFPHDFGPESCHDPGKELKDMDSEEYKSYRKKLEEDKQKVKLGYERIKEKVKNVRQDYRSAVSKGTRSGSGKLVQDNYDLLFIYYYNEKTPPRFFR